MLQFPWKDLKPYAFEVYNRNVRALVKNNLSDWHLDDYWADAQVRDVIAQNEDQARALIDDRFPSDEGFVVGALREVGD
jgi:hypothetical protein